MDCRTCIAGNRRCDMKETPEGREVRYSAQNRSLDVERIFEAEQEAAILAKSDQEEHEARETANKTARTENNYKSYAWHVGYHMKQAKDLREKAEYHDRRAILCKTAAK